MEQTKTKKRDTNFELLRIIAMLMVVALHLNGHGKIMEAVPANSISYYFSYFLEYGCIIAVNLYVMITGYYMIKSKIKIKRIIGLELQIIFYTVGIYLILSLLHKTQFNIASFIKMLIPVVTNQYWFMTAYMGLYLVIPFINKFANSLNKNQYKTLLIVLTILLSVLRTLYPSSGVFEANGGYGLCWFIYLYLLAGYIRLHFNTKIESYKLVITYFGLIMLQIALREVFLRTKQINIMNDYYKFCLSYNSIFILIESIAVFLTFKKIKIKNEIINKCILAISPLTLGVYLIHEQPFFRKVLWEEIVKPSTYIGGAKLIIAIILGVLFVFTIGCIIEKLRQLLFKLLAKTKLIKLLTEKVEKIDILSKLELNENNSEKKV